MQHHWASKMSFSMHYFLCMLAHWALFQLNWSRLDHSTMRRQAINTSNLWNWNEANDLPLMSNCHRQILWETTGKLPLRSIVEIPSSRSFWLWPFQTYSNLDHVARSVFKQSKYVGIYIHQMSFQDLSHKNRGNEARILAQSRATIVDHRA